MELSKFKFYEKVEKYEKLGYELLPESFNGGGNSAHNCVLMRKKDWKNQKIPEMNSMDYQKKLEINI